MNKQKKGSALTLSAETRAEAKTRSGRGSANLGNFVIRAERVGPSLPPSHLGNATEIRSYYRDYILPTLHDGKEHLHVIPVDARLAAMGFHLVSVGSLSGTDASLREILRPIILSAAYGLAVVHNHPSGDPRASTPDIKFTEHLAWACRMMGLRLVDHVIVGTSRISPGLTSFSFVEAKLLDQSGDWIAKRSMSPAPIARNIIPLRNGGLNESP